MSVTLYQVKNRLTQQRLFKCSQSFRFATSIPADATRQWFTLEEISQLSLSGCDITEKVFERYEIA